MEDEPQVTTVSSKTNKKPDEMDKWISELENNIDIEKLDGGKEKEQKGPNEDYYDEEYDHFHDELQDIYPNHSNGKKSVEHEENKEKEDKTNKHIKEQDFDYGRLLSQH